jgi:hypothetical protein
LNSCPDDEIVDGTFIHRYRPGVFLARVRSFAPSTQVIRLHTTEVDCEYVVVGDGVERVVHLSTFGSDDRQSERKSSQSIQLDRESAAELVAILLSAFPDIPRP